MPSIRTEYVEKRRRITREMINKCISILELDFEQISSIPLSDFSLTLKDIDNMLFSAIKPRQIDAPETSPS